MGKVLVAYASKYGATGEIAQRIGAVLNEKGIQTQVLSAEQVGTLEGFDAVVAGSAVYMGRVRKPMRRFLTSFQNELARKPVWLFSSGPTKEGDDPGELDGWQHPKSIQTVVKRVKPKGRQVFGGAVSADKMTGFDKWVMKKVNAPIQDIRDWDQITAWAGGIADSLPSH